MRSEEIGALRVMLIEDDPLVRDSLAETLAEEGIECPSSDDLGRSSWLRNGVSGSPGLNVMRPAVDAASGGVGWCGV